MKAPPTLMFVVICEWLLEACVGFVSLMFLVYGFYGLLHLAMGRFLSSIGVAVLLGILAAGCFYTGSSLWSGRRWAWGASWGIGAVTGLLGWGLHSLPSAGRAADFGTVGGPILLLAALTGFVMLSLPQARKFLGQD